jgi:hypothetical protein
MVAIRVATADQNFVQLLLLPSIDTLLREDQAVA